MVWKLWAIYASLRLSLLVALREKKDFKSKVELPRSHNIHLAAIGNPQITHDCGYALVIRHSSSHRMHAVRQSNQKDKDQRSFFCLIIVIPTQLSGSTKKNLLTAREPFCHAQSSDIVFFHVLLLRRINAHLSLPGRERWKTFDITAAAATDTDRLKYMHLITLLEICGFWGSSLGEMSKVAGCMRFL